MGTLDGLDGGNSERGAVMCEDDADEEVQGDGEVWVRMWRGVSCFGGVEQEEGVVRMPLLNNLNTHMLRALFVHVCVWMWKMIGGGRSGGRSGNDEEFSFSVGLSKH